MMINWSNICPVNMRSPSAYNRSRSALSNATDKFFLTSIIIAHYLLPHPKYTQILSQALSVHPLNYRAVFHKAASEIILTSTNVHIVIKHGIRYTVATTQPSEARPSRYFSFSTNTRSNTILLAEGATSLNLETFTPTD